LVDWQRQTHTFEAIAGWRNDLFTLTGRGPAEQLMGEMVSADFFSVLRVQPLLGRPFRHDEDQPGGRPVALLGEGFWARRFAADPQIVGQVLTLNGRNYSVIGVVPASVRLQQVNGSFLNDVFLPIAQNDDTLFFERGVNNGTLGLGRLKPGVSVAQARAEMQTIASHLATAYPDANNGTGVNIVPFKDDVVGDLQPLLLALAGAVGFVLLIACTNVASLMLARSTGRAQEFALRVAIGASRGRIIRQLLTESVLLSCAGGVIGVAIAACGTRAALEVLPSALPAISHVVINAGVLVFAVGLSLLTGILFALIPAIKATGSNMQDTLKQGGRNAPAGRHRTQRVFIVAEIALTLILLVGAGLMIRSLARLWSVNPGFEPQHLLTFYTGLSSERASSPEKVRAGLREIDDRLAALPGVEAASLSVGALPFSGNTSLGFWREDEPRPRTVGDLREAVFAAVGPQHFRTMHISLLRGRTFTRQDDAESLPVVVIDEELARSVFHGQDPLGKHIRFNAFVRTFEVIGVVGHVKHAGLDTDATASVRAQIYIPYMQLPDNLTRMAATVAAALVRSTVAPASLVSAIRQELGTFDSTRAIHTERMMTDVIAASLASRRFTIVVLGTFAGVALLLSIVGIYGVVSYLVGQRTHEIGVRMALGAQPADIRLAVLGEGGTLAAIGIASGVTVSLGVTRLLQNLLFGVSATDPLTFGSVSVLLLVVTLGACYLPARRAMRVNPMVALRNE
jgi:predicted permease